MTKKADASDKNSEIETEKEQNEAAGKGKTGNGIIIKALNKFFFNNSCTQEKRKESLLIPVPAMVMTRRAVTQLKRLK